MCVCVSVWFMRAIGWFGFQDPYTTQAWFNEPYRRIVSIADCSIRSYAALASAATEDKASVTGPAMAPNSIGYQLPRLPNKIIACISNTDFQIQVCKLQVTKVK